uniref:TOG domain-containing protein n=1 Tax=Glossina pallidipes TaxID=7398 RepID=A0A1A9ZP42_GLOPL
MLTIEREMAAEEIQGKAEEILTAKYLASLSDSNRKNRLIAVENVQQQIADFDPKMRGICQIREKLADIKNGGLAAEVLTAFAEAIKLDYEVGRVLSFAFEKKSPKVQSEALNWVNKSILKFGFQIQSKFLIEDVQSTNPTVRGSAIALMGTMVMYMDNTLIMFFVNEKPQIQAEFDRNLGEKPPKPIRGLKKGENIKNLDTGVSGDIADKGDIDGEEINDDEEPLEPINLDLSPQITEV